MKTREQIDAEALEKAHAAYLHTSLAGIAGERFNDAGVCLDAAIAAYEAALWQPIEDAPSGESIFVFDEAVGRLMAHKNVNGNFLYNSARIFPTHFRYPPKPPENI